MIGRVYRTDVEKYMERYEDIIRSTDVDIVRLSMTSSGRIPSRFNDKQIEFGV